MSTLFFEEMALSHFPEKMEMEGIERKKKKKYYMKLFTVCRQNIMKKRIYIPSINPIFGHSYCHQAINIMLYSKTDICIENFLLKTDDESRLFFAEKIS